MKKLWVDLETEFMKQGNNLWRSEYTITEMDTLCYQGQYYQITNNQIGTFRLLVPIDNQLDDFDLGPQCEEYYIEE